MKRIPLMALAMLLFCAELWCAPVPFERALALAQHAYLRQVPSWALASSPQTTRSFTYSEKGQALLHVFEFDGQGCVLTSADDRMLAVLGLSMQGKLDAGALPPGLGWLLQGYLSQARKVAEMGQAAEPHPSWNAGRLDLSAGPTPPLPATVGPLLGTTWNQTCYYNALCPTDGGGSCGRAYTGCGATAMAQVMKYMAWPDSGFGAHSYTPSGYPLQSVDYGATGYNWGAMPNSLGSANAEVAKLMHHCGVAIDMMYSTSSSNAYFSDMDNAMREYFRYSLETRGFSKIMYSDPAWDVLLQGEIDASRPMLFNGGTHFWVLDGYQTGPLLYHMNWGWGGAYNGWFALTNLTPGGQNFSNSGVIAHIKQPAAFEVEGNSLTFGVGGGSGNFEVVSDSHWVAAVSAGWLSLSANSGPKGYALLSVTAVANPTYLPRTGYVSVARGNYRDTVWVSQDPRLRTLYASPATVLEGSGGGVHPLSVSCDSNWVVSGTSGWISVTPLLGAGAGTVSATVTANAGGARTGYVAFARAMLTDTVVVDQSGAGAAWCVPPVGVPTATGISKVVVKTLSRTSLGSEGYLLAADSTLLMRDSTYSIYVSFIGSVAPAIWMDWNQDGDFFDAGEAIMGPVGSWYPTFGGTKTTSFMVPASAGLGMTRMRVYTKSFPGPTSSPCAATGVGDVEDYNVWIGVNSPMATPMLTLRLSPPNLLSWDFGGDLGDLLGFQVEKMDVAGFVLEAETPASDFSFEPSGSGLYRVAAMYRDGARQVSNAVEVNWAPAFSLEIGPNPVQSGDDFKIRTLGRQIRSVSCFDVQGRHLGYVEGLGGDEVRLGSLGWPKGTYILRVEMDGQTVQRKLMVR